ncbi:piggyBac transposable element-derived protein 4-like [Centruroides sculpturatus]|uniref:piggyBac transposable element-derived protein 4-like n=1 Tax=Centruroides sculpturatus TaxID=218467 RepID=UPI000C6DE272|nr:piggyBac transposable element-derived protein 4-like [Centruroides sculpturatus]
MLSTVHGAEMVPIQTKSGEEKLKPLVCVEFSKGMRIIDLADQCITTYSIAKTRLKKYYHKMFHHLLDFIIFNSFILYKKCGGTLTQLNFRLQLVDQVTEKYCTSVELRNQCLEENTCRKLPQTDSWRGIF